MFVLGTAGHIDHGKSVLVRALTGIDPDRLREEKERGMTIDLGFAWFKLPGGREVGIVDVPGHERFVKNMLAGVGGIDLAMLIVAANEGVMPQTKEHLAILDLLRVPRGLVALTKADLVDDDLLALVKMEVEELVAGTVMSGAPVLPVSAMDGRGMPELVAAIDDLLKDAAPRRDLGRPRLPVDRVFTMSGSGTVVTGTLIDGSLQIGQEVEIVPKGLKSRLRGLQTHKAKMDKAEPGSRVAANLVGVNTSQIGRGDVVTRPGWLKASGMLTGRLRLIDYLSRPLKHGATVSLHTGATETMAKVRLLEAEELKPGESGWVQLLLEHPVAAIKGDRFIVRSPMETLGGGDIVDTRSRRLRRFRPEVLKNLEAREGGTAAEAVLALLEAQPQLTAKALATQSSLPADEAVAALEELIEQGQAVALGEGEGRLLLSSAAWEKLRADALAALAEYHRRFPARPGMPKMELSSRLKKGGGAVAVAHLAARQDLVEESGSVRLPSHAVSLTPAQQDKVDAFLAALKKTPYAPPSELVPEADLLNLLAGQGKVVKVAEGVVFSKTAYDKMVADITARIKTEGKVTVADVRDMFQTSRKYVLALLEHLDGLKVTRRVGDDRVLYK